MSKISNFLSNKREVIVNLKLLGKFKLIHTGVLWSMWKSATQLELSLAHLYLALRTAPVDEVIRAAGVNCSVVGQEGAVR